MYIIISSYLSEFYIMMGFYTILSELVIHHGRPKELYQGVGV